MFWVYENWTHDRARLHAGHCSHCREGQSRLGSKSTNGRWLGPFASVPEASRAMNALVRGDSGHCGHCDVALLDSNPV